MPKTIVNMKKMLLPPVLGAMLVLSACASDTTIPQTSVPDTTLQETASDTSTADTSAADTSAADTSTSDSVIWTIETDEAPPEAVPQKESETASETLAREALAAAFALSRRNNGTVLPSIDLPPISFPPKKLGHFRLALLLPQQGKGAAISRAIYSGAETALFTLDRQGLDMVLIDTSNTIDTVAEQVNASAADIILGPLFSEKTIALRQMLGDAPPMISFSNDTGAARHGVYVFGTTPEQEIERALDYASRITTPVHGSGRHRLAVAIVSQDDAYGRRVAAAAEAWLAAKGVPPQAEIILNAAILASEENLRTTIRSWLGWQPAPPDTPPEAQPIPPYDMLVLAGDVGFALRVAPILAWYDLDSEQTQYIGTSLWAAPAILQEPSLRRGIFATAPQHKNDLFTRVWGSSALPSKYARLGFDAVAVSATLMPQAGLSQVGLPQSRLSQAELPQAELPQAELPQAGLSQVGLPQQEADFHRALTTPQGFAGFSGAFRFLEDGTNIRLLDVHAIGAGTSRIIAPARRVFE